MTSGIDHEDPGDDSADLFILHSTRLESFPAVRLGESACGGRGLFAARAFTPGEEILREVAVCWGAPDSPNVFTTMEEGALVDTLLQMAPACWRGPPAPRPPVPAGGLPALVAATMKANAWGCRVGGDAGMRGLFPVLCLSNHSCASVAAASQVGVADAGAPAYALTARAPIAEGEEITVAYVPRSWEKARRAAALGEGWGFACGCARCAAPVDDTRAVKCACGGRGFLPDDEAGTPACAACGAPLAVVAAGAAGAAAGLPPPPHVDATPQQLRAALDALLAHPVLALDDARVLFALNSMVPAVSQCMEGGNAEAEGVFKDLLRAVIAVAQQSGFVNLYDLGISIE
jgi:hypothetical protein